MPNQVDKLLPFYFCLDRPEKIKLMLKLNGDFTILWVEAKYCRGDDCKTEQEIKEWKNNAVNLNLDIITNK